jgi:hypothetical protein
MSNVHVERSQIKCMFPFGYHNKTNESILYWLKLAGYPTVLGTRYGIRHVESGIRPEYPMPLKISMLFSIRIFENCFVMKVN